MSIIHAVILWASLVFRLRGRGRRIARPAVFLTPDRSPSCSVPALVAPRPERAWPPAHRSPYGLDLPLDGEDTALVRPYLVEHEERQERVRQRRRRLALVLAVDFGVDLDRHLIGAAGEV
nr:hypothetical protein [Streptomyces apocyni]